MKTSHTRILAGLLAANVDYAVVGGVAVNAHGYLRATNDIDLFIRPTEENAIAAFTALRKIGVALDGLDYRDLLDDERNVRFGREEDHVDILASIGEMPFDQVWRNRIEMTIDGLTVPMISKADLIENKRQIGRLRDLADVEELERLPDVQPS